MHYTEVINLSPHCDCLSYKQMMIYCLL